MMGSARLLTAKDFYKASRKLLQGLPEGFYTGARSKGLLRALQGPSMFRDLGLSHFGFPFLRVPLFPLFGLHRLSRP